MDKKINPITCIDDTKEWTKIIGQLTPMEKALLLGAAIGMQIKGDAV